MPTYAVSLVGALVGLGLLATADTGLDVGVAVVLLVLSGFSALESRRRSRSKDEPRKG